MRVVNVWLRSMHPLHSGEGGPAHPSLPPLGLIREWNSRKNDLKLWCAWHGSDGAGGVVDNEVTMLIGPGDVSD